LFSLLLHPTPEDEDYLVADLWECGATGIAEEDSGLRAYFDASAESSFLIHQFDRFKPELREEPSVDWSQVSRDAFPPLMIGQRFYLVAPWHHGAAPEGRLRLEIEPGMACGTGRHPATQLCLEALERVVRPGDFVLDVGTGSGILAQAARLLGAASVAACDIDPEAVEAVRQRMGLPIYVGSAGAARSASQDIIVANIDAATIELLAPELCRVRKPDSTLVLSGFEEWDQPEGFRASQILRRDGWVCLVC
jgi:ribosomal protein L11 methyltransferase